MTHRMTHRPRLRTGALAGIAAGTVMSMAMMLAAWLRGDSIWAMPNLISVMWLGPAAAGPQFGLPTITGFLTHEATSLLMGIVAIPFLAGLSRRQTLLVSLAYSLAAYPLAFSLVMRWANPVMFRDASMNQLTWAHLLFGAVMAAVFIRAGSPEPHARSLEP